MKTVQLKPMRTCKACGRVMLNVYLCDECFKDDAKRAEHMWSYGKLADDAPLFDYASIEAEGLI